MLKLFKFYFYGSFLKGSKSCQGEKKQPLAAKFQRVESDTVLTSLLKSIKTF